MRVIITNKILFRCAQGMVAVGMSPKTKKKKPYLVDDEINVFIIEILLVANITLMIIDQIHFQYNGFLFGILLVSIANILKVKLLILNQIFDLYVLN